MKRALGFLAIFSCLLASVSAPAAADTHVWTDPSGGGDSYLDIRAVKVSNTADGVLVVVRTYPPIDWQEISPVGHVRILLDTDHRSAGPEFAEYIGMPGHGDFRAVKGSSSWRRSWQTYGDSPGRCGRSVVERFEASAGKLAVLIRPRSGCLVRPRFVRVNVRTVENGYYAGPDYEDYTENEPPLIDHYPAKGSYTGWVRYSSR